MAVRLPKGPADRRPIVQETTPVAPTMAAAILVELITEAPSPRPGPPIMVRKMAGGDSPRVYRRFGDWHSAAGFATRGRRPGIGGADILL